MARAMRKADKCLRCGNCNPILAQNDPGDSDPVYLDAVYAGGPLVVERIAPDLAAMREYADELPVEMTERPEDLLGELWRYEHTIPPEMVFADIWYGYRNGECIYSGPFESMVAILDRERLDRVRSPNGDMFKRSAPDLMAAIRTIARGA